MNKVQGLKEVKRVADLGQVVTIEQVMASDYIAFDANVFTDPKDDVKTPAGAGGTGKDDDDEDDEIEKFSIYSFIKDDATRPIRQATIFKIERMPVYALNSDGIKVALKGTIDGIDYDRKGTCFVYTVKSQDKPVCTIPYAYLLNQAEKVGVEKALIMIAGSKCKIQYHNIGDSLYNDDIVEKENYYCSAFSVDFSENMFITALAMESKQGIAIPSMKLDVLPNDYEVI